jgi:predicted TIM-barrel fold metal-dependent hydrolase
MRLAMSLHVDAEQIDAHQHYWDPARGDYGWLTPELTTLYRRFLPEDLAPLRARCGVARTVVVQAAPTLEETRYLLDLARADASIAGVVGWVPLDDPHAPEIIADLAQEPKLRAVRPMLQDLPDDNWIATADIARGVQALIAHDLAFDALIFTRHAAALERFLARYPALRVVIDHGAKPPIRDGAAARLGRLQLAPLHRASAGEFRCESSDVGQRLARAQSQRRLRALARQRTARVRPSRRARTCGDFRRQRGGVLSFERGGVASPPPSSRLDKAAESAATQSGSP